MRNEQLYELKYNQRGTKYYTDEADNIVAKQCSKCREIKELTDYHKYKNRLGGVKTFCKECTKNYYSDNKEQIGAAQRKYRSANKEQLAEYKRKYREDNKEQLAENSRMYYSENKKMIAENKRRYYSENKEHITETQMKYRSENKERIAKRGRKYYAANKKQRTEYYAANKKRISENTKKWQKANPEKGVLTKQRRLARKKALPDTLTPLDLILFESVGCYLMPDSTNLHLEHFIPLSWGLGGTTFENCYYMDGSLNSSKGNKNAFEWAKYQDEEIQLNFYNNLVPELAERNDMTVEEFRIYVYECESKNLIKECRQCSM